MYKFSYSTVNFLRYCSGLSVAISFLMPVAVSAQAVLEEIVVTAQKKEQALQEVGLTISAFGGDSIKDRGLLSVDELAAIIPNLQSTDDVAGQTHFRIRGIGLNEFQSSFDAPVAVHVDEFVLSKPFMTSMGMFDIGRIEVLKGPQGTVFGRNTTGGAVNYYTNKPTDEFSAGVEATIANYERAEFEGYVSGPLSGQLKGRLAVRVVDQNSGPYFNIFDGENIGYRDETFRIRGQLAWNNNAGTDILLTAHHGTQEGDLTPYDNLFQDIPGGAQAGGNTDVAAVIRNPLARFVVNSDYAPTRDNTATGVNFTLNHDIEGVGTITSLTSYEYFERDQREDSDNTPVPSVNIDWYSEIDQFTQELRISGSRDRWDYLLGAFYEKDDVTGVDTIDVGGARLGDEYVQEVSSFALFTNHELTLNDTLKLVVGARYTRENTKLDASSYVGSGIGIGRENRVDPATYFPGAFLSDVERTDDDINFKVGLTYIPSDDLTVYGSFSTGFRSGGYDVGFNTSLITFEPESVDAFELGFKSKLLNDSLQFNGALFYTLVDNYQENANLPTEMTPRRRNVGELETKGAEVDLQWLPTEKLSLSASLGYTDSVISESDFIIGDIPIEGNTPANSPEFSSNIYAVYTQPIGDKFETQFQLSWSWVDERFLEIENQADHLVDSYSTVDARLKFEPVDGEGLWSVSIWGKNLTDEVYLRYINDVPGFGLFLPVNAAVRTYGATFAYNF